MARPRGPRPGALFHGTNVDLAVGDRVLPAALSGAVQAHPRPDRAGSAYDPTNWAHATSNEHVAWRFAERAAFRAHRGSGVNYSGPAPGGTGRARVYRLEPEGQVRPGLENRSHPDYNGPDSSEYVAKSFRVTGVEDIQPPADRLYTDVARASGKGTKRGAVPNVWGQQGTLPVDWTQHGADHPARSHPHTVAPSYVPPTAAEPRQEVAGQESMFPVPKVTGRAQAKRLAKLRGPR